MINVWLTETCKLVLKHETQLHSNMKHTCFIWRTFGMLEYVLDKIDHSTITLSRDRTHLIIKTPFQTQPFKPLSKEQIKNLSHSCNSIRWYKLFLVFLLQICEKWEYKQLTSSLYFFILSPFWKSTKRKVLTPSNLNVCTEHISIIHFKYNGKINTVPAT